MLNHLTDRPLDYGIKDYDLNYFDESDLSYEAEDAVIRPSPLASGQPCTLGRAASCMIWSGSNSCWSPSTFAPH